MYAFESDCTGFFGEWFDNYITAKKACSDCLSEASNSKLYDHIEFLSDFCAVEPKFVSVLLAWAQGKNEEADSLFKPMLRKFPRKLINDHMSKILEYTETAENTTADFNGRVAVHEAKQHILGLDITSYYDDKENEKDYK